MSGGDKDMQMSADSPKQPGSPVMALVVGGVIAVVLGALGAPTVHWQHKRELHTKCSSEAVVCDVDADCKAIEMHCASKVYNLEHAPVCEEAVRDIDRGLASEGNPPAWTTFYYEPDSGVRCHSAAPGSLPVGCLQGSCKYLPR